MGVKCCRLCASSALQLEPVDFWALPASDGGDFGELWEINFHPIEMAKSKNHTAHNQSRKAHRNGIKKPQRHRHTSTKGEPKVRQEAQQHQERISHRGRIEWELTSNHGSVWGFP
ncbi:hypothetical protein GBA52_004522 [Prunus armeniaca]|nr:hypothetical protein GBA52_004522 [Prunus armeniaca]